MYATKSRNFSGYIPPSSFNAETKSFCPSIIKDGINKYPIPNAVTSKSIPVMIKVFFPKKFRYFFYGF